MPRCLELSDKCLQRGDLRCRFFCAGGKLLGVPRVCLRYTIEFAHAGVDLVNSLRLLIAGRRDLGQQLVHTRGRAGNFIEGLANARGDFHSTIGAGSRVVDHHRSALCRLG